eukprot:Sdes_comp25922_c0_seq1m22874
MEGKKEKNEIFKTSQEKIKDAKRSEGFFSKFKRRLSLSSLDSKARKESPSVKPTRKPMEENIENRSSLPLSTANASKNFLNKNPSISSRNPFSRFLSETHSS